jgi:hypothetical protein
MGPDRAGPTSSRPGWSSPRAGGIRPGSRTAVAALPVSFWPELLEARWQARLLQVTELSLAFHDTAERGGHAGDRAASRELRRLQQRTVAARRALADTEEALGRLSARSRTTGATRWVKGGASSRRPWSLLCRRIGRNLPVGITALGVQVCTRDRCFRCSGPRLHLCVRQAEVADDIIDPPAVPAFMGRRRGARRQRG